jgi:2,3-bisphosphoglycerate-independent phosphoglycerate mutase
MSKKTFAINCVKTIVMKSIKNLSERALMVILDGYGINDGNLKNAVKDANTPNLDQLFKHYPTTLLTAGGEPVGLPKGVSGNSEVGHMNLGAGRSIRQDLVRINESIDNETFAKLPALIELKENARLGSKRIHLMGLLSDGGVHSHINHLKEIISALQTDDLEIFLHVFMDGRDTARDIGERYLKELDQITGFHFASMQGRSIGMDRDRRWEKIKTCYDTFTGQGAVTSKSPTEYLKNEYEQKRFDEFITPALFNNDYAMREGDSVFMFNFRPDRAIQITQAMTDPKFKEFERIFRPHHYLCMTPYIPDEVTLPILFDKERVQGGFSEYLSELGLKQLKIAETEKYAHVTFFFNGGDKKPYPGEEQVLIPSPRDIQTYDQKPEMSAELVTEHLLKAMGDEQYSFYLVNFANSDMVGHTGNYPATIKALEYLDHCVERLMKACEKHNITMVLTADHGNSDQMVYDDGSVHTSHTGAPVPFSVFHKSLKGQEVASLQKNPALKDVAPTLCHILNIEKSPLFTGESIFN